MIYKLTAYRSKDMAGRSREIGYFSRLKDAKEAEHKDRELVHPFVRFYQITKEDV